MLIAGRIHVYLVLPLLLVGLVIAAAPGTAEARIRPGNAVLVLKTRQVLANTAVQFSVACPAGDRAITGGAYWHLPGQDGSIVDAALEATAPFQNGGGWYVAGHNTGDQALNLTVSAQCLSKSSVPAYTVKTRDIIVDPTRSGTADLRCGSGQQVIMGGAVWHRANQPAQAGVGGFLSGSWPDADGRGWSVAGFDGGSSSVRLKASVFCLPSSAVGGNELTVSSFGQVNLTKSSDRYLFCPSGKRVLGGGSFWAYPVSPIEPPKTDSSARIMSSTANGNGGSWYAGGVNLDPTLNWLDLAVVTICIDR